MRAPGESLSAFVDRLAGVVVVGTRQPVGKAECGCPNRADGTAPLLHICLSCGFTGDYEGVHQSCQGCGARALLT